MRRGADVRRNLSQIMRPHIREANCTHRVVVEVGWGVKVMGLGGREL